MNDFTKELHSLLFILIGILMGFLLAIGIKYPLEIKELEKVEKICRDNKIHKIRVGVNGRIYEVICSDGIDYKIKPTNDIEPVKQLNP